MGPLGSGAVVPPLLELPNKLGYRKLLRLNIPQHLVSLALIVLTSLNPRRRAIMAFKRVSVINEDSSGRNLAFRDNVTGEELSRAQFVRKIKQGEYDHR